MNLDMFGYILFGLNCIVWKYAFGAHAETEVTDPCASMQSDQDLRCPLTDSLHAVEYDHA